MLNQERTGTRGPGAGQRAMPQRRALRLARRAQRRRGDGSRGPLARRAWRILAAAADGGDRSAISAVYRSWLRAPDEETWKLLSRWRAPSALAADVLAAAADPGRPAGQRALLGAFCARHGLAPEQDGPRALFHVLTGQAAQHRAADPDGTLLAAAYRAAEEPARAAVREALAEAGDLDLARAVLVARDRDRVAPQAGEERRYLARQLADHRDWAGLWRLAKELPLAEAVTATRLSGDGWPSRCPPSRAWQGAVREARARPPGNDRSRRSERPNRPHQGARETLQPALRSGQLGGGGDVRRGADDYHVLCAAERAARPRAPVR